LSDSDDEVISSNQGGIPGRQQKKPRFLSGGNVHGTSFYEWLLNRADPVEFRRVLRVDRSTFDLLSERLQNPRQLEKRSFSLFHQTLDGQLSFVVGL
jgi:hypothetical protein